MLLIACAMSVLDSSGHGFAGREEGSRGGCRERVCAPSTSYVAAAAGMATAAGVKALQSNDTAVF